MGKKRRKREHERSRADLLAENRILRRQNFGVAWASVINTLIAWSGAVLIFYFAYLSVKSLAGRVTFADIGIRMFGGIKLSEAVAGLFGVGGAIYGLRQSKLRKDTIERLQSRIKTLERALDPDRSSSGLTPRGETHPRDEI